MNTVIAINDSPLNGRTAHLLKMQKDVSVILQVHTHAELVSALSMQDVDVILLEADNQEWHKDSG